jgi:hypothetical protein
MNDAIELSKTIDLPSFAGFSRKWKKASLVAASR